MRSFITKSVLAAILMTSSIGLASAQSGGSTAPMNTVTPTTVDQTTTSAVKPVVVQPRMIHRAAMIHHRMGNRQRLSNIVQQVRADNHRLGVDLKKGYLTRAEFKRLDARDMSIRHDAMRVAARHHGALPRASYVAFERQLNRLGHTIHHDAVV